jgi:hypothetical protein
LFSCDNLKRGWRKRFTLWTVEKGAFQDDWAIWQQFEHATKQREWSVDAAFTEAKVVAK